MLPQLRAFYFQNLCIKDRNEVKLKSNIWNNFESMHIDLAFHYCLNSTENGDWCKTKDDIDQWLNGRAHGIVFKETRINANLWADSIQKQDEDNYFPTTTATSDANMRPFEIDSSKRDNGFKHYFMFLTKNKLTIDDSIIWPDPREMEFLNLVPGYEKFLAFKNFEVL